MNYLTLSKVYKSIEDKAICEHTTQIAIKANNYTELESKLTEYGHDFTEGSTSIDVKYKGVVEEASATPDELLLGCDNTSIEYSKVLFLIKIFCSENAEIEVKDEYKICRICFEKKYGQLPFDQVKEIIDSKNETNGLTTSSKIEYILVKNKGKRLSCSDIYEIGKPWNLKTLTPRNSVYARVSSLFKKGLIKKDGILYYVD